MREDAVEADKARLILSETAPGNALELLQRLVVREPDITPVRARAILEAAGARASPALCSTMISDTRPDAVPAMVQEHRIMERMASVLAGLVCPAHVQRTA